MNVKNIYCHAKPTGDWSRVIEILFENDSVLQLYFKGDKLYYNTIEPGKGTYFSSYLRNNEAYILTFDEKGQSDIIIPHFMVEEPDYIGEKYMPIPIKGNSETEKKVDTVKKVTKTKEVKPCKKHSFYKGIRKPLNNCEECQKYYDFLHPEK
jgi:hypothetical protein